MTCQKNLPLAEQIMVSAGQTFPVSGNQAADSIREQTEKTAYKYWNDVYRNWGKERIVADDWLTNYGEIIAACPTPILDLGCGEGNDVLSLTKLGKEVVACDYAPEVLHSIQKNFSEHCSPQCFDLRQGLPFQTNSCAVIIADLCLHYFSTVETKQILAEIKRVLRPRGHLLVRVNSLNDTNHYANQGQEIEPHYFLAVDGLLKRFFTEADCRQFFAPFKIKELAEKKMLRYRKEKILYELLCQKE